MNRNDRKHIARQTLQILHDGKYSVGQKSISIASKHRWSVENSIMIPEGVRLCTPSDVPVFPFDVQIFHGTSMDALLSLHRDNLTNLGVLSFASAKNPCGGFLKGSMAQEESLAYSSGLYDTLIAHKEYYDLNRSSHSPFYTGNAIFSPSVVFFRDSKLQLLPEPFTASVVSLPAVNLGAMRSLQDVDRAGDIMRMRMQRILDIFISQGVKNIVLGDYGCGIFKNNPQSVRNTWLNLLTSYYAKYFQTIYYTNFEP